MLHSPGPDRRRRALAHACTTCHRPWALRAVRDPDGVCLLVCRYCAAQQPSGVRTGPVRRPRDHEVLFPSGPGDLVRHLAEFVVRGLAAGEPCIVVATAEHRRALRQRVGEGVLVAAAQEGAYVELDAADTLGLFLRDGRPDADLFDATVGAFVRDHTRGGRVRAYSEMAALLWADGHGEAALALEGLGDDLMARVDLTLLCAFDAETLDADGRRELCRAHSGVAA